MILSIDTAAFPAIDRSMEFDDTVFKQKERDILNDIIDKINRKFDRKFAAKKEPKESNTKKAKKAKKSDDIGSLIDEEKLAQEGRKSYNLMEEFFSYLGKLKTATNIYKEHFIQYTEKKDEPEPVKQHKTNDMNYNEFEEMIRVKKINDIMSGGKSGGLDGGNIGYERSGASMEEKWQFLRLFAHYKVMAMLRYTFSMT